MGIEMINIREELERMRQTLREQASFPFSSLAPQHSVYLPNLVKENFHDLQQMLGIQVLGFIILDPIDTRPIPLFSKDQFFFPFLFSDKSRKDFDSDLNEIFDLWRQQESISYPLSQGIGEYPPEYHYYSPTPHLSQRFYDEKELSYRRRYGCHYVPVGEIIFFILTWRLLMCFACGSFNDIDAFLEGLTNAHQVYLVSGRIRSARDYDLRKLLTRLPKTSREYPIFSRLNLLDVPQRNRAIPELSGCDVGTSPCEIFLKDLFLFDLLTESSNALALFTFASYINKRLKKTLDHSSPDFSSKIGGGNSINYVIKTISDVICAGSIHQTLNYSNATGLLKRLHELSRFPVVPYYYWYVVDPTPKAHLTFSTWNAYSQFYKSLSFDSVSSHCDFPLPSYGAAFSDHTKHRGRTNIYQAASAFAVLGVSPLLSFDWTYNSQSTCNTPQIEQQFNSVREYTEILFNATYNQALLGESYTKRIAASKIHRLKTIAANTKFDLVDKNASGTIKEKVSRASKRMEMIRLLASHTLYRLRDKKPKISNYSIADIFESLKDAFVDEGEKIQCDKKIKVSARCDPDVVKDILFELINNSIRYGKQPIQVSAHILSDKQVIEFDGRLIAQDGYSTVLLEVKDKGKGIPPDRKESIFEPGIGSSDSSMGLWICRANLQSMVRQDKELVDFRTSLWEDGTYGEGSRFRFAVAILQKSV